MKTKLPSNIPQKRLNELHFVIKTIKEELEKKDIEIDKIILFWSYARWNFVVEDIREKEEFRSDFDILIVTKKDLWEEEGLLSMYLTDRIQKLNKMEQPLTLIVENLNHINTMLKMWRYFYADIKREWVVLLDSSWVELSEYKELTREEKEEIMKEDYEMWYPQGKAFLKTFRFNFWEKEYKLASFHLHQAVECFMTAYLLVKTQYKEKSHDLTHLYTRLKQCDSRFDNWFDFEDSKEFVIFQLLREAYVWARYDRNYTVTKEELEFLEKKVVVLKDLVKELCDEEMKKI